MTNENRLLELKRQRDFLRSPTFRMEPVQVRRDTLSVIVPLLNFNPVYYENALPVADILGRPHFSGTMYDHAFAQIDTLVGQAINELELGVVPQPVVVGLVPTASLTDEHGILWFWHHCTYTTKWWLAAKAIVVIGSIFGAGFAVGRLNFFVQAWKLWKGQP